MATITPRWEWRTFGQKFGSAETVFARLTPNDVQESDEIYLLSATGSNVKIRGGLLDIKDLQEVNSAGLEQWMPVMKEGFPLSATTIADVFKAMNVVPPPIPDREFTLDEFLHDIVELAPQVLLVNVHKRRVRYDVGGCMAEFSDISVNGKPTRTIAVELEDPHAVLAAVDTLGLTGYFNTNYPRGLQATLDGILPRYAVIDVGTNSVKFHLGELAAENSWRAVLDRAEVTRLGEGLEEHGTISEAAVSRTAVAISGMVSDARTNHCLAIAAVGTAGLRIAKNASEVIDEVQSRTGIRVEIISGEEEARLAYLAVQSGLRLGQGPILEFDSGGGSSQFTFGQGEQIVERFSLDVGAVRYTERFGLDAVVATSRLEEARAAISSDLSRLERRSKPDAVVGMGGTVTNLTAVSLGMETYEPDAIQGAVLSRTEIERQIELYRTKTASERRQIAGLQPKRADIILAGACIVLTILEKVELDSLTVSDRGLRHGLLADRFGR